MQRNNKCKSTKSNQDKLSRSETSESCSSRSCENQSPEKHKSLLKELLKADSGCQMCEICREITGFIVEIEQNRTPTDCTECISKSLHVLCNVCLANVLSQRSGKSGALKKSSGGVLPCNSSTCEFSSSKTVPNKDNDSNSCRATCNAERDTKISPLITKCPNQNQPEKPYEMCFAKCNEKSDTVSKNLPCGTTKKRRTPCGANSRNSIKSQEKRETKISKPKGNPTCGVTTCNKKTKGGQKRSKVTDIDDTESQSVTSLNVELRNSDFKGTAKRKRSISIRLDNLPEFCETRTSSSIETLRSANIHDNYEVSSNKTEYGDWTDDIYASESGKDSDTDKGRQYTPELFNTPKEDKDQSLMICANCQPCFPLVQGSIVNMEQHCTECAQPDKIQCKTCLNSYKEHIKTSRSAVTSVCCDPVKGKADANETAITDKKQSLMVCATCEPCYISVQESIVARDQHGVKYAEPAKIECDNCLTGNYKDKNSSTGSEIAPQVSKVVAESQISPDGRRSTSCCECEDNNGIVAATDHIEEENHANKPKVKHKDQSLMVCGTCEPCYPSIRGSIAAIEQHCTECAKSDEIQCENCLNSDEGNKTSSSAVASVSCDQVKKEADANETEIKDKVQSLIVCETCEPCHLSVQESIAAQKQHCFECSETVSQIPKVVEESNTSPNGCQSTYCGECEDNNGVVVATDNIETTNHANDPEVMNRRQSLMVCKTCEPCYPSVQESIATMELHCVECAQPDKIKCERCLNSTDENNRSLPSSAVASQISKVPVDMQISPEGCRNAPCCECEDEDVIPAAACDRAIEENSSYGPGVMDIDAMICGTCEQCCPSLQKSVEAMVSHCVECAKPDNIECEICSNKKEPPCYANVSTNISFTQSDKQVQCKCSELSPTNSRIPKEGCQSHKCCQCDNDLNRETMNNDICVQCESCKQSINERSPSNEIHCPECSNTNEIICESCLKINSKHDDIIINTETDTIVKCTECIGEKCVATDCQSCEKTINDMNSKESEIRTVVYCKTCEECKESFSKTSETTHCSTCADSTNVQCESCLEIENKQRNRLTEDQLDAKLIYQLVCETCKQLSGDKGSSEKGCCSIERDNETNDSRACKIDVKCSMCSDCSKTNCGDCEANNKIIDEYFGQEQSTKIKKESTASRGKNKHARTSKLSANSLNCTDEDCPNCGQMISKPSIFDEGSQKKDSTFGCGYCEACKACQTESYSKENGQLEDNCLDCIDINNILCESCLKLINEQNRIAGTKRQSSQTTQQPRKTYKFPDGLGKENSSKNNHDEGCICCVCTDRWSNEKNVRNLGAKEKIAVEKHSEKLEKTFSCSCSSCSGSEKHQISNFSRGTNTEIEKPYKSDEMISVSISESVSDTSTGDYTSHSFAEPKLSISHCSSRNVLDLDGALLSEPCQDSIDERKSQSKQKCSCHIGTNTSESLSNNGGAHKKISAARCLEFEEKHSRTCQHRQVANSPKGECGTALKYKLSENDRASEYVLLDGPVFIKKCCVDGKDKICKSTSGTPVRDTGDSSANASQILAVIDQHGAGNNRVPDITIDLKILKQQISASSDERPQSILVKEVTRVEEDNASDASSYKEKNIINWDPEVEITPKRRVSMSPMDGPIEMNWNENDGIPDINENDMPTDPSLIDRQRRQSLLKDTILDQVVREHKRRESVLPAETPELQADPLVDTQPESQKRRFSLSLFKKENRKKKFTKTISDVEDHKREGSDSESSDESSKENIGSSGTRSKHRGSSKLSANSK